MKAMSMSMTLGMALGAFAVAAAASTTFKAVPPALDPATGYVLVRLGERAPDVWNVLTIAPYDTTSQDIRGKGRAKENPVAKTADQSVRLGEKPFLAEEAHLRTYLVAVTPGTYVIESGPTTCFCLGSYRFDIAAGRITDMGTIYLGPENGSSPWAQLRSLRSSPDIEARGYTVAEAIAVLPAHETTPVPVGVASLAHAPARYEPAGRFGNHEGKLLNRALPLETK